MYNTKVTTRKAIKFAAISSEKFILFRGVFGNMNTVGFLRRGLFNYSLPLYGRLYSTSIGDIHERNVTDINLTIQGWIKSVRKMKENIFFDVNDGTTYKNLQIIINKKIAPKDLNYGSSVQVCGKIKKVIGSNQLELHAEQIKLIGICSDGYPFSAKKYDPEYVREHVTLRPRTNSFATLLRLRDKIFRKIHEYFEENQFIFTHTPILTSNDSEGAGEIFKVIPENKQLIQDMLREDKQQNDDEVFFNSKTYLTVSGQLSLECLARSLRKVYCFGPTFRAENSKSRLHLAEFYMIEAEMAFINSLDDLLHVMEDLIKKVTINILNNHEEEIVYYRKLLSLPDVDSLNSIVKNNFKVMSYEDAICILNNNKNQFVHPVIMNKALTKEHELFLVKHNENIPVFVINWPANIKPFYMKCLDNDATKVASVDLLLPNVGELCGGSIREDNYDKLKVKLEETNLLSNLNWYLELRKFGNVCTGGFGMGFERFLSVILGTPNIKDTIPFPRYPHNCKT